MFNFSVAQRRAARIVAGLVLITGAIALLQRGFRDAYLVLGATWAAGAVAYVLAACVHPRRALEHTDERAVASFVLPSVGVVLLLPFTLHAIVSLAFEGTARSFDEWITWTIGMTAPAHLMCALLVWIRAARLARGKHALSTRQVYLWTVVAGCVPGAIFVLPPLVIAVTGLPIALFICGMEPWIVNDRFAATQSALPRAIAVA